MCLITQLSGFDKKLFQNFLSKPTNKDAYYFQNVSFCRQASRILLTKTPQQSKNSIYLYLMVSATEQLLQAVSIKGKHLTIKRGEHILRAGETEHHLYLIKSGLVRVYYLTEFEEHTIRFGYKGSAINSLHSYLSETPSDFSLEALKNTSVIAIKKSDLYAHLEVHNLYKTYTLVLEDLAKQQIERELDLLTHSPFERYQRVMARSPHLFLEAPAKYIASYLRMTPETLSRVRNS